MNTTTKKISIVIPVFEAEEIVSPLVKKINDSVDLSNNENELILVDDGSYDNSWKMIEKESKKGSDILGIKLSRNFGQHYAILAGLNQARGEIIIVMDCDLQHDPTYIKDLIYEFDKGYDIVFSVMENKKFNFFKNFTSFLFYKIYNFLLDDKNLKVSTSTGDFTIFSRKVLDEYLKLDDYKRHHVMVLKWLGFKTSEIKIEHKMRKSGRSTYTLQKLFSLAFDTIIFNSNKVLNYFIGTGLLISGLAFLGILYIMINSIFFNYVQGWPSLFVIILFSTGLIILSIGVLGLYIGKTFDQTKNRPKYIVEKSTIE